ncbi:hypothetical protein D9619_008486 [Psilocybe cf. subviscida]|uniref:Uncharacterized protein n=1 Tax=Psilocybe cf. subviscida TaxID=2480587 RepID=A0A8H5F0T4_9AGAR|nr:hypothetical protein D9619_008486 [Psilocybe cf. subviscida]
MSSCASSSTAKPGERGGWRCACFPQPSCFLFPRHPDGTIMLPNPTRLTKERQRKKTRRPSPQRLFENACLRDMMRVAGSVPCNCSRCTDATAAVSQNNQGRLVESSTAEKTNLVNNYAQLSVRPEFKAFKINPEGELEDRNRGPGRPGSSSSTKKAQKPVEWLQEIHVPRRTKKQNYVRSGTHDFCIRLYTGQNDDAS